MTSKIPAAVTRAARQGAFLAVGAAAVWAGVGLDSLLRPEPQNYRNAIVLVSFTLTAAVFNRLRIVQRAPDRRLERYSYYALMVSMVLALIGQVGVVFDISLLESLGFPLGALLWLVALVPYGIATVRAGVLPRHVGVAISLLEVGSIAFGLAMSPISPVADSGAYTAGIEKAFVLLLIARALAGLPTPGSPRAAGATDPRRVSAPAK